MGGSIVEGDSMEEGEDFFWRATIFQRLMISSTHKEKKNPNSSKSSKKTIVKLARDTLNLRVTYDLELEIRDCLSLIKRSQRNGWDQYKPGLLTYLISQ